jgi:hypothetical protein
MGERGFLFLQLHILKILFERWVNIIFGILLGVFEQHQWWLKNSLWIVKCLDEFCFWLEGVQFLVALIIMVCQN